MGLTFCPKCDEDIFRECYDLEIHDFGEWEKLTCPYCGAKLKVRLEAAYYIEEENQSVVDESTEKQP